MNKLNYEQFIPDFPPPLVHLLSTDGPPTGEPLVSRKEIDLRPI